MTFNVFTDGVSPASATTAMQNWRHVNYGNDLLPVDSVGTGTNGTLDLGSSSYKWQDGYINNLNSTSIINSGFTQLGDLKVKCKELLGNLGAAEGSVSTVPHGSSIAKIRGIQVLCGLADGSRVPPAYTLTNEAEYTFTYDDTNVYIRLSPTNSGSLVNNPYVILVWYTE